LSEIDPGLLEERLWALEERRFSSTRIQLTSVTDLGDALASIIEIGQGSGHFSSIMKGLDYAVKTANIRSRSNPDYLKDFRDACSTPLRTWMVQRQAFNLNDLGMGTLQRPFERNLGRSRILLEPTLLGNRSKKLLALTFP
jgi:hypothetical protein